MSGQIPVKPSAEGLAASAKAVAKERGLPPVHLWNPPFLGNIEIQILRDGTWIHEGGEIKRPELVRLFSSILRKDGDSYFLVTPVEKVGITVEDAPFVAVDVDCTGTGENQILTFTTNVGDTVTAGPDAPIRLVQETAQGEPAPYVMVRAGLEARLDRKTFYRMVELGTHHVVNDQDWYGVWSYGVFFPLILSQDLE
ncbi:proteophosphoglycan precursor [Rhodobacteraceae bacterium 4F10]|nr:proteophosphoglycan precursor [Rhodobacteraceae bacterium 4F10]